MNSGSSPPQWYPISAAPRFMSVDKSNDCDDPLLNNVPKNITELAEKKVRLAKAQAEIDRILNSPVDPPFDAETELKKVVGISPPLVPEGSPEYTLEEQVSQMEQELYKSVKQTNFAKAAQQSKEISQMHIDDCGLVLQVNSKFYQAFNRKDVEEMRQVWLPDRSCICIHPSHKPLVGIQAIQNSWDQMFQSSNGSYQRNWMEPQEIRLTVKATTAIVTCEEHVYARRFIRGQRRQTELVNKLQATNIFRKVGGRWHMTYHHASWHAESEAAKQVLKQQQGGKRKGGKKSEPPSEIDNILGVNNFGPLLGDESKSGSESRPVKRVIMGSLSDILNGNLGGLLGEDDDDDDDDDEKDEDSIKNGAIIRFSRVADDEDDDEDEDFDDDDDEEDEMDTLDQIKDWAKKDSKVSSKKMRMMSARSKPSSSQQDKRQGCIAALRKLANEGRISAKQKRSLLTDIISCSTKGELSMVEVAYDLLCRPTSDANVADQSKDDAEEEFADQCIVFAQTFAEYKL